MSLSLKQAAWLASGNARRLAWEIRFWAKVNKDGPLPYHAPELGPCWIWTGAISKRGYGQFRSGNSMVQAHRFIYEKMVGPIPQGLEIDHICVNKACIRYLGHIEPVTGSENIRRYHAHNASNS